MKNAKLIFSSLKYGLSGVLIAICGIVLTYEITTNHFLWPYVVETCSPFLVVAIILEIIMTCKIIKIKNIEKEEKVEFKRLEHDIVLKLIETGNQDHNIVKSYFGENFEEIKNK